MEIENSLPTVDATNAPPPGAGAWEPISKVAKILGCSAQWLRNWIAGRAGPALEARELAGRTCLVAETAYQHIRQHAKRLPPDFRSPNARAGVPPPPPHATPTDTSAQKTDPHRLLLGLLNDTAMSNESKKTLVAIAGELRRKAESDSKRETLIDPSEVIEMFTGLGDIVVEAIEAGAPKLASDIVVEVREKIGVDLTEKNIAVNAMLQAVVCAHGNELISRVRKHIADELEGVRELEAAQ